MAASDVKTFFGPFFLICPLLHGTPLTNSHYLMKIFTTWYVSLPVGTLRWWDETDLLSLCTKAKPGSTMHSDAGRLWTGHWYHSGRFSRIHNMQIFCDEPVTACASIPLAMVFLPELAGWVCERHCIYFRQLHWLQDGCVLFVEQRLSACLHSMHQLLINLEDVT